MGRAKVLALVDAWAWNLGRARGCLASAAPAKGSGVSGAREADGRLGVCDGHGRLGWLRRVTGVGNRSPPTFSSEVDCSSIHST